MARMKVDCTRRKTRLRGPASSMCTDSTMRKLPEKIRNSHRQDCASHETNTQCHVSSTQHHVDTSISILELYLPTEGRVFLLTVA